MTSARRDFYEILGVASSATYPDIYHAFADALRREERAWPGEMASETASSSGDLSARAWEIILDSETRQVLLDPKLSASRASEIKEAYEAFAVLSDPDKRSRYDRFGHAGIDGGSKAGPDMQDFHDIFEGLFGVAKKPQPPQSPAKQSTLRASPPAAPAPKPAAARASQPGASAAHQEISKAEMEGLAHMLARAAEKRLVPHEQLKQLHAAFVAKDRSGATWSYGLRSRSWNRYADKKWTPGTPPETLLIATRTLEELRALAQR